MTTDWWAYGQLASAAVADSGSLLLRRCAMGPCKHVVSLGSSFAAGPSIEPEVDANALRSGRNYAALLAKRMGARHTDISVSGATTANVLSVPQRPFQLPWWNRTAPYIPPQIDGVPADADLALITIGGCVDPADARLTR